MTPTSVAPTPSSLRNGPMPLYAPSYVMSANRLTSPMQTMNRNAARRVSTDADIDESVNENPRHLKHGQRSENEQRGDRRVPDVPRLDMIGDPRSNARAERNGKSAFGHHGEKGRNPHQQRDRRPAHSARCSAAHVRRRPHTGRDHALVAPLREEDRGEGDRRAAQDAR